MSILQARAFAARTLALLILSLMFTGCLAETRGDAISAPLEADGLQPERAHRLVTLEIIARLKNHYRTLEIIDALSAQVMDRYLKDLYPQRVYFLEQDIHEIYQWRNKLDDQLREGDLSAGFLIYNRFLSRSREAINELVGMIAQGLDKLDLESDDTIELDRSQANWPANEEERRLLWRKRLKDAVLTMRLNGDDKDEMATRLKRRYKSQLGRLEQSTSEDAYQSYINAFTMIFDPHTSYYTPHNSDNFNIQMSRSLEGIGAVLQAEEEFTKVVRLVPGGPAAKAGQLRVSDRIIAVGQEKGEMVNVIGRRLDEVVNLIRGPKDSKVRLEVIPANSPSEHNTRVIEIVRNKVVLEDQAAKSRIMEVPLNPEDPDSSPLQIGVISLPTFYVDFDAYHRKDPNYISTTRDVIRLLQELEDKNINGLILDLRDNGGGSLQEAIQLVSLFVDQGPTVQVRAANGAVSAEPDVFPGMLYSGPFMVLVNRFSASASEIFAGAMQDYGRALIVGEETFGKGTVQSLMPLRHGQLKMTQAKFYRVSGGSNQHRGVVPDIRIPFTTDHEEIGESALQNALPWDSIAPVTGFAPLADLSDYLATLRAQQQQRQQDDFEFRYIEKRVALQQQLKSRTVLPLNLKKREQEQLALDQAQLELENWKRTRRGQETFSSLKEWTEHETSQLAARQAGDEQDGPDPHLEASVNIMRDFVRELVLHPERLQQTAKHSPLP